jgi:hypothetical protein
MIEFYIVFVGGQILQIGKNAIAKILRNLAAKSLDLHGATALRGALAITVCFDPRQQSRALLSNC